VVETAEAALEVAIETIRADVSIGKISAAVESVIKNRGFKPISNLTGHSVGRYLIHAGTSIPNVSQVTLTKIKSGEVYAIEPFVTLPEALGVVEDEPQKTIFRLIKPKAAKSVAAKQLSKFIEENFRTLPFTERWLEGVVPSTLHNEAFKELIATKALMGYPVFVEVTKKPVAQAEHTVIVEETGCTVLT